MHPKSWENTKISLNPHGQDFRVGKKMHQLQKQYDDTKSLNPLLFTVEQRERQAVYQVHQYYASLSRYDNRSAAFS